MYAVVITDEGGARRKLDFSKSELTVGRVQGNDIVLSKRNVSKQHARLTLKGQQAVVVDLNSTNGTWVNGRKITSPQALKQGDKIYIADFIITLEPANDSSQRPSSAPGVSEPPPLPAKQPMPPTARCRSGIPWARVARCLQTPEHRGPKTSGPRACRLVSSTGKPMRRGLLQRPRPQSPWPIR